jgi:transcriptional regulator with XRE-family HTH domain
MTQKEFAKNIGIPEVNLSLILNDKRAVGVKTAKKIAQYLGRPDWRTFIEMPGQELRQILANNSLSANQ